MQIVVIEAEFAVNNVLTEGKGMGETWRGRQKCSLLEGPLSLGVGNKNFHWCH